MKQWIWQKKRTVICIWFFFFVWNTKTNCLNVHGPVSHFWGWKCLYKQQFQKFQLVVESLKAALTSVFHWQPLRPTVYQTVCVKCNKPSEDSSKCQNCGNGPALLPCQQATLSSPTPRPPIRSQPSPGLNSLQQNFYKPVTTMRAPRGETLPIRITSTRGTPLPLNNGRSPQLAGTSSCCGARNPPKGKRAAAAARQHELNDPSE